MRSDIRIEKGSQIPCDLIVDSGLIFDKYIRTTVQQNIKTFSE